MKSILFLILTFVSSLAWSYPVYFKCEKNGILSQVITPNELADKLQQVINTAHGLSPEKQKQFLSETCRGGKSCIEELEQLLKMSQISGNITEAWVKDQLNKVKTESAKRTNQLKGLIKLPAEQGALLTTYNSIIQNAAESEQCRISESQIPADKLKLENDRCIVANLHHSPYMYVAGIRESGTKLQGNMTMGAPACSSIDLMIEGAVASGQDPYAALAISFMENGTEVHGLYLDPIGMVQTLGCKTSRGSQANHNLNSFNTFYNAEFKTIENSSLINKIKNYLAIRKIKTENKVSYFCNTMGGGGESVETPSPNSCCLKLPFSIDSESNPSGPDHPMAKALTFKSMDQYVKAPLADELKTNDPSENAARRLQRFNGYSTLMGGAEAVSAWRSGVNYYKTPAYGYQAMDFLVNSMISNPYIRSKVEAAEAQVGTKSPSVLCLDLPPGLYGLEHDYYFKKHANSPRMEIVLEKWNKNKKNPNLSKAQANVMRHEFFTLLSSKKYPEFEKILHQENSLANSSNISIPALNYYFEKIYPERRTVALANKMDQGFEWNEMQGKNFDTFLASYKKLIEQKKFTDEPTVSNPFYESEIPLQYVDEGNILHIAPQGTKMPSDWKLGLMNELIPPANFKPPSNWKTMIQPIVHLSSGKFYIPPKDFKVPKDWPVSPYGPISPKNWKPDQNWKECDVKNWMADYSKTLKDQGYSPDTISNEVE